MHPTTGGESSSNLLPRAHVAHLHGQRGLLRRRHVVGILTLAMRFVTGYAEEIKKGRSEREARASAFGAIGESHLFGESWMDEPLHSNLFSLLHWRGHTAADESGWKEQIRRLVPRLLERNGLPTYPDD